MHQYLENQDVILPQEACALHIFRKACLGLPFCRKMDGLRIEDLLDVGKIPFLGTNKKVVFQC